MRARWHSVASIRKAEIKARPGRAITLGSGIFVAATCFGLLSSATATSRLQVNSIVKENFRAAYDILVRPKGAATAFERNHGVVDDGFLSGLFGGITMKQYREIRSLPGVSLAAPVANVGYFTLTDTIFVPFPRSVPRRGPAVYRVTVNWDVHKGLEHYPAATFYVFWTGHALTFSNGDTNEGTEQLPGLNKPLDVCHGFFKGQEEEFVSHLRTGYRVVHGKRVKVFYVPSSKVVSHPYTKALEPKFSCASPSVRVTGAALKEFSALAGPKGAALRSVEDDGQLGTEASGQLGTEVDIAIPVLVAGVDPSAEQQLVGLKSAMTSGNYLAEGAGLSKPTISRDTSPGTPKVQEYPVIASTDTYLDEVAKMTIEKLHVPSGADLATTMASAKAFSFVLHAKGEVIGHTSLTPNMAWHKAISDISPNFVSLLSDGYWRSSPTTDKVSEDGVLTPKTVSDDPKVWSDTNPAAGESGVSLASPGANDTWYRHLEVYGGGGSATHTVDGQKTQGYPLPELDGTFDPAKLRGFSPLSKVPLQTFYPPTVTAGNKAAKTVLGSQPLGPTTDLAGYLSQPPLLLTTLNGAIALDNGDGLSFNRTYSYTTLDGKRVVVHNHVEAYQGASPKAPVSTVQVRVKGVTGPNSLSLAKIKLVAEQIEAKTGLTVNITAGSSPTPELVHLSAGKFGQPPLLVEQDWVKEDVSSGITQALSTEDLDLFLLVLVTCGFFVAGAVGATVRQRRKEIATLGTLGWSVRALFSLVIGEVVLTGLLAGALGDAVAVSLARAGSLQIPAVRLALVVPVAVGLAVVASVLPVSKAARMTPLDAMRDPVPPSRRHQRVRSTGGLALSNLLHMSGSAAIALATLVVGECSLAIMVGLTLAFRGRVAGTLLGNVVSLHVRGVDVVSAALLVVVGAGAVTDVLVVSLRERASELATLRALGWAERSVLSLAAREGLVLGALGSVVGASLGTAVVAFLGAALGSIVSTATIAIAAGIVVTTGALVAPLSRLGREAPVRMLAAE